MKKYSIVHVPVLSFYSKALYRDVYHQWKGTGFAYLLLLLAVCWIGPIFKLHLSFSGFVDNEAASVVSQFPTLSIVGGKASIDEPQPYRIIESKTGETIVVIDTTGTITSLADVEAHVLITQTQAVFKKNDFETRTFDLGEIEEFTLDQEMITGWLAMAKKLLAPSLYVLAVVGSFVVRIVQLLIYACIGMLFAKWLQSSLEFVSLLRLAVIAVTPGILIKNILSLAQVNLPFAGFWYFLAGMGFLFFGVKAASHNGNPTDVTIPL